MWVVINEINKLETRASGRRVHCVQFTKLGINLKFSKLNINIKHDARNTLNIATRFIRPVSHVFALVFCLYYIGYRRKLYNYLSFWFSCGVSRH